MGMLVEETPSTLHAGYSAGDRRARPGCGLVEVPDRLVGQAGQPGQPFPAAKERPQPPRERDDYVAVGDRFKDLLGDELAERRLPLRVTGGTETALLTREREQVLVPAIGASDTGEAMGQNPAALEALRGAGDDSPERAVSWGVAVVVDLEEGLSVARNKLPERRGPGFAGTIDRPALG
jgi:hypothetical protein